jgi:hypothetical protein
MSDNLTEQDKQFYAKLCIYGGTGMGFLIGTSILGIISPFVPIDFEALLMVSMSFSFFGFLGGVLIADASGVAKINPYAMKQAAKKAQHEKESNEFWNKINGK